MGTFNRLTAQSLDRMVHDWQEHIQAFSDGFGASRKIYDQRPAADASNSSREHRPIRHFHASKPHRICDPGHQSVAHFKGRFRRHVPRRQPRPTTGKDDIHL